MQPSTQTDNVQLASDAMSNDSLAGRWYAWRNALLMDPKFHRWARRNFIARFIARRRARDLFDLCAGFVYTQVLTVCVELDVFELLKNGPQTREAIAKKISLTPDSTDTLLRSAVSLRLLQQQRDQQYVLGVHGAALLANPGVLSMIEHHKLFYRDLANPIEILRDKSTDTQLSTFWNYSNSDTSDSSDTSSKQAYTRLMSQSQRMVAEQIVDAYPLQGHRRLLDVAGGDGTFLRTVASAASTLELVLFDLPKVVEESTKQVVDSKTSYSIQYEGGDMFKDELPKGADVVSLVRVVHDHDDADVEQLLKRCFHVLPTGGTLLLAEPMATEQTNDPSIDAYFSWYLHAMGRGKPRTRKELTKMLSGAGFTRIHEVKTQLPMLVRLLVASR